MNLGLTKPPGDLMPLDVKRWPRWTHIVYFIQSYDGGPVKIGTSTIGGVGGRLKAFQSGNPLPLRIVLIVGGNRRAEAQLHRQFEEDRMSGEWFAPSDTLLEAIRNAGGDPA